MKNKLTLLLTFLLIFFVSINCLKAATVIDVNNHIEYQANINGNTISISNVGGKTVVETYYSHTTAVGVKATFVNQEEGATTVNVSEYFYMDFKDNPNNNYDRYDNFTKRNEGNQILNFTGHTGKVSNQGSKVCGKILGLTDSGYSKECSTLSSSNASFGEKNFRNGEGSGNFISYSAVNSWITGSGNVTINGKSVSTEYYGLYEALIDLNICKISSLGLSGKCGSVSTLYNAIQKLDQNHMKELVKYSVVFEPIHEYAHYYEYEVENSVEIPDYNYYCDEYKIDYNDKYKVNLQNQMTNYYDSIGDTWSVSECVDWINKDVKNNDSPKTGDKYRYTKTITYKTIKSTDSSGGSLQYESRAYFTLKGMAKQLESKSFSFPNLSFVTGEPTTKTNKGVGSIITDYTGEMYVDSNFFNVKTYFKKKPLADTKIQQVTGVSSTTGITKIKSNAMETTSWSYFAKGNNGHGFGMYTLANIAVENNYGCDTEPEIKPDGSKCYWSDADKEDDGQQHCYESKTEWINKCTGLTPKPCTLDADGKYWDNDGKEIKVGPTSIVNGVRIKTKEDAKKYFESICGCRSEKNEETGKTEYFGPDGLTQYSSKKEQQKVCGCREVNGTYYGTKNTEISKTEYLKQCKTNCSIDKVNPDDDTTWIYYGPDPDHSELGTGSKGKKEYDKVCNVKKDPCSYDESTKTYYDADGDPITGKNAKKQYESSCGCRKVTDEDGNATYYGPTGEKVSNKTFKSSCCRKEGDNYYFGNVKTTKTKYEKACPTSYKCTKVDDTYYDTNGKKVTEEEYKASCEQGCRSVNGIYYGPDGKKLDGGFDEWKNVCTCKPLDNPDAEGNTYLDSYGNPTTEANFKSVCACQIFKDDDGNVIRMTGDSGEVLTSEEDYSAACPGECNIEKDNSIPNSCTSGNTGSLLDPPMCSIIKNQNSRLNYEKSYLGTNADGSVDSSTKVSGGSYCQVYCRDEYKFEFFPYGMSALSGSYFKYDVPGKRTSGTSNTAVVFGTRQCTSTIDYTSWFSDYTEANNNVKSTWDTYMYWQAIMNATTKETTGPVDSNCTSEEMGCGSRVYNKKCNKTEETAYETCVKNFEASAKTETDDDDEDEEKETAAEHCAGEDNKTKVCTGEMVDDYTSPKPGLEGWTSSATASCTIPSYISKKEWSKNYYSVNSGGTSTASHSTDGSQSCYATVAQNTTCAKTCIANSTNAVDDRQSHYQSAANAYLSALQRREELLYQLQDCNFMQHGGSYGNAALYKGPDSFSASGANPSTVTVNTTLSNANSLLRSYSPSGEMTINYAENTQFGKGYNVNLGKNTVVSIKSTSYSIKTAANLCGNSCEGTLKSLGGMETDIVYYYNCSGGYSSNSCTRETKVVPHNFTATIILEGETAFYQSTIFSAQAGSGDMESGRNNEQDRTAGWYDLERFAYPVAAERAPGYYDISAQYQVNGESGEYACTYIASPQVPSYYPCYPNCDTDEPAQLGGSGLYFRTVDLEDLFPNTRNYATNWTTTRGRQVQEAVETLGNNVFIDPNVVPMYEVTLTSQNIKVIKEYNKTHKYTDNDFYCTSQLNCKSLFLTRDTSSSVRGTYSSSDPKTYDWGTIDINIYDSSISSLHFYTR